MIGLAGGADAARCGELQRTLAGRYRWLPAALKVVALEALPLASNGKPQYGELLALIESHGAAPVAAAGAR